MTTIYYTASSLDGFIADPDNSLDWLLSRDIDPEGLMSFGGFRAEVGAGAVGATTYQWVLDQEGDQWDASLPTWVFTHRDLAPQDGVTFTTDDVRRVHAAMTGAAAGKNIWLMGGGDLVGQFADAGLLDEVWVQYAPVVLGGGAPLLPRRLELSLEELGRNREFLCARYTVSPPG
ncbi:dihydrofolate reductase family protein [Nocardioides mangrovi]|uniref:Dihydrofolate reductase family protein n=1 Tax=Nocardioides mangrovi TaxID=2874580 RepID=A0ABS7U9R6_9ACTN|nr:dihydrofolate reductase family protein [Nocardioides mangrovi]MBZ5737718.1 dihydrofolate reductase family protein [Nocardioides mangrovi]